MCSSVLLLLKTTNLINEYKRLFETGNVKTPNKKRWTQHKREVAIVVGFENYNGLCARWPLTRIQELKGCNAIIAIGLAALRGSAHLQCLLCTLSIARLLAQRVKWCAQHFPYYYCSSDVVRFKFFLFCWQLAMQISTIPSGARLFSSRYIVVPVSGGRILAGNHPLKGKKKCFHPPQPNNCVCTVPNQKWKSVPVRSCFLTGKERGWKKKKKK
jgi:hypothetical protein